MAEQNEINNPTPQNPLIIENPGAGTTRLNLAPDGIAELLAVIAADKERKRLVEEADREYNQLIISGDYIEQPKAERDFSIKDGLLSRRSRNLNPLVDYLEDGRAPMGTPGEVTVKGSVLRWQHPYNNTQVLVHKKFAKGIKDAEERYDSLLATEEYIEQHKVTNDTGIKLSTKTKDIDPQADYLEDGKVPTGAPGEITVKGSLLRWQHPFDQKRVLLHKKLVQGIKNAEEEFKILVQSGDYIDQVNAGEDIGMPSTTMQRRSRNIDPNADYLEDGSKPAGSTDEIIVKGSILRWQHPYGGHVLIHKKFAKGIKDSEERYNGLLASGDYIEQHKAAKDIEMSVQLISKRANKIDPNGDYLEDGTTPTGKDGEVIVKGSILRQLHQYDYRRVLLYKKFIKGMKEAEERYNTLLDGDYIEQVKAAGEIRISSGALVQRTNKIYPEEDYLEDGREPTGISGEITVKGSILKWQHPYDKQVLLYKKFVNGMKDAEKEYNLLASGDYMEQAKAAKEIGIKTKALARITRNIDPQANYLEDGKVPEGIPDEVTVKGSILRWQHPYNFTKVLIHKRFVQGLKYAEEEYNKRMESGDYLEHNKAAEEVGIQVSSLSYRVSDISPQQDYLEDGKVPTGAPGEITVKGSVLRWQHPYTNQVLLSKEFIKTIKQAVILWKGRSSKIGTASPENVPDEAKAELDKLKEQEIDKPK